MKYFDKLVFLHGKLSDKKFTWFPFVFLKPRSTLFIGFSRKILMTLCFSVYGFVMKLLKDYLFSLNDLTFLEKAVGDYPYWFLGFFLWFSVVTVPLWNLRAKKLKNKS